MEFKTQFSGHVTIFTEPGCPLMNEYGLKYRKDGSSSVEIVGKTNFHEKIQVDADSCDINLIVKRFTNGETDALNKVRGIYFDATDFPANYAELLQRVNDGNALFEKLPIETKQKFNNNADEFWSQYGSSGWLSALGITPPGSIDSSVDKSLDTVDNLDKEGEK